MIVPIFPQGPCQLAKWRKSVRCGRADRQELAEQRQNGAATLNELPPAVVLCREE
jgi:hypothetical protein